MFFYRFLRQERSCHCHARPPTLEPCAILKASSQQLKSDFKSKQSREHKKHFKRMSNVKLGVIQSITMERVGGGYVDPHIDIEDATGRGAKLKAEISCHGELVAVNVMEGGENYQAPKFIIRRKQQEDEEEHQEAVIVPTLVDQIIPKERRKER